MNRYYNAMEHCTPPADLEERLRSAVLTTQNQNGPAIIRPWGIARKALLAAVLIGILTLSVGAALLVNWDSIFDSRFGDEAATTPMADASFQPVNISSVCGDVTLTVREALVDDKTIYLILDYHLPDTVDWASVQTAWKNNGIHVPDVNFYATGEITWDALRKADHTRWSRIDWADVNQAAQYLITQTVLSSNKFTGGGSITTESRNYDPETGIITYLIAFSNSGNQNFSDQPLTMLVTPPVQEDTGDFTALADSPAILTFQPSYISQSLTGSLKSDSFSADVTLSPFAIHVSVVGGTWKELSDLRNDTTLVFQDGTTLPVKNIGTDLGGGGSYSSGDTFSTARYTTHFGELLDISQVVTVQIGSYIFSLS